MTPVVGSRLDSVSLAEAIERIRAWALARESRYVCVANVHAVMAAHDSIEIRRVMNDADLVVPDGMPLVWMLRLKGHAGQERVYGPALMERMLEEASRNRLPIGLYGSTPDVLSALHGRILSENPGASIAFEESPPFEKVSGAADAALCERIASSGTRILFVGLGCPKQERWMAAHRDKVPCVMIGVGAAFDFLAGKKRQAPRWMQNTGLEWLFRLATEPGRLWRRYLHHNPRFVVLAAAELLHRRSP
ncbi:MAG TPA: WecB/TagA/CpsF family glycosyltransferase [Anaerolineales bacterium]